jgi:hypothetical protein
VRRVAGCQLAQFIGKKWVAGPHSMWFLAASNLMWTTMELIMSTTFYTPATIRVRSRVSVLIATVKKWWMSYLTRRIERAAIIQLHGMSERELRDIRGALGELYGRRLALVQGRTTLAPAPVAACARVCPEAAQRGADFKAQSCP